MTCQDFTRGVANNNRPKCIVRPAIVNYLNNFRRKGAILSFYPNALPEEKQNSTSGTNRMFYAHINNDLLGFNHPLKDTRSSLLNCSIMSEAVKQSISR